MRKTMCLVVLALMAGSVASAQDYPRAETFLGYDYTRFNSATNVPAFSANGGNGQFAINANRWLGFVFDAGAVHNGNIGSFHTDTTFVNFLFGPRVSFRHSRVRPYINTMFGGVYAPSSIRVSAIPVTGTPVLPPGFPTPTPGQPVTLRANASQTAFAMTAGGGIDIKLSKHVAFRPIGLDYFLTRLQNLRSANDNNQNNLRYTAGFNFMFGGEAPAPAPAPMRSCWDGSSVPATAECPKRVMQLGVNASKTELCPGESVSISPSGTMPQNANYQWTVEGQPAGQGPSLDFTTAGREPGTYKVGLTATAPEYNDGTAGTTITVRPPSPPTGTVQATPSEISAGEQATVAANFTPGQCGCTPGTPVLTASEGTINGNQFDSSSIQFDPASSSEQRKTVTISAKAGDEKCEATAQTTLVVKKAPAVTAKRLPDIIFPANSSRVNNCGKRVLLEDLRAALESDPGGQVVFVGHNAESEAGKAGLDQQRALNAAAVISAGQGICYGFPAQKVMVGAAGSADNGVDFQSHFCGTTQERPGSRINENETDAKYRRVEVWFVPSGGAMPASATNVKDAGSLSVSGLGCPR